MEEPGGLLFLGTRRVGHNWSNLAFMHALEKEMVTHSSILAWRIPWTEEPGRLQSTGLQKVKHDFTFTFTFIHDYCKNNSLDEVDLSWQNNVCSRSFITFLPRSKHLLISWLLSPSAVILEPQKIKPDTVSIVSPSISHEVMAPDAMILVFWMLSFKPTFLLSSFTFLKRFFSSSSLLP